MKKTTYPELKKIIILAKESAAKAYAPYSKFYVGCALELSDQKIITGFNIENAVLSNTVCAEKVALFTSKVQGYQPKDVKKIVIFNNSSKIISPCGGCRQVISELANKKTQIVMVNKKDEIRISNIEELLPFCFDDGYFD